MPKNKKNESSQKDSNPFDDNIKEETEDSTFYGEFVPSFHCWIPSEDQRIKARYLGKKIED